MRPFLLEIRSMLTSIDLATQNASATACAQPVRDLSADFTYISLSFGGFALLVFIIRIVTRLSTQHKKLFWDDYTMILSVVCVLPANRRISAHNFSWSPLRQLSSDLSVGILCFQFEIMLNLCSRSLRYGERYLDSPVQRRYQRPQSGVLHRTPRIKC